MVNNFMKGYRRSEEMTDHLSNTLMAMLNKYPELRLGQLIVNCCGDLVDTSSGLFNIFDEKLLFRLEKFDEYLENLHYDKENRIEDWKEFLLSKGAF